MRHVGHGHTIVWHCCTYSREIMHTFSDVTKALILVFGGCCLREIFPTLREYNLAQDLRVHIRFDDLDLISRSWVCQNYLSLPVVPALFFCCLFHMCADILLILLCENQT